MLTLLLFISFIFANVVPLGCGWGGEGADNMETCTIQIQTVIVYFFAFATCIIFSQFSGLFNLLIFA